MRKGKKGSEGVVRGPPRQTMGGAQPTMGGGQLTSGGLQLTSVRAQLIATDLRFEGRRKRSRRGNEVARAGGPWG